MIRRISPLTAAILGACLSGALVAAAMLVIMGGGKTAAPPQATPTATASPSPSPSASLSASPSASGASPSASLSGCDLLSFLPHQNRVLEKRLPENLPGAGDGIWLCRASMTMADYLSGGETVWVRVHNAWLVKLGKAPGDVYVAAAKDYTDTWNVTLLAVEIPGATADVAAAFAQEARQEDWPVTAGTAGGQPVFEITDPRGDADNGRDTAYVFSKGDIAYFIITDDPIVLTAAMATLLAMQ